MKKVSKVPKRLPKVVSVEGEYYWRNRSLYDSRKDWHDESSWIDGYWNSKDHPHRQLIVSALRNVEFNSVLEVGCNAGPNLALIRRSFELADYNIGGVDVNLDALEKGKSELPGLEWCEGSVDELPFLDKTWDVVIADAVLMYVEPERIEKAIEEMVRVARKGLILVEWHDKSVLGKVKDFHWARNYEKLLADRGLEVEKIKITKDHWPTKTWEENGYLYTAKFPVR